MNNLENINNGMLTIDSREVAKIIGKEHGKLLRDIRTYISQMNQANKESPNLESPINTGEYFIESAYINSQNKEQPCYLLTKLGCEFVSNKMTGVRGTAFTAVYTKKFNDMEQRIKVPTLKSNSKAGGLNGLLKTLNGVMKEEKIIAHKRAEVLKDVAGQCGIIIPDDFVKKPAFVQVVLNLPVE
jgi:Rha family phage regulatory protein